MLCKPAVSVRERVSAPRHLPAYLKLLALATPYVGRLILY
ncbi:hypothetical protein GCM10022409_11380 [Hymenobacter glaciei]|uniref:Uncharacterized protein n=1 Tax=Hymenobacter glaciei TaxID=877209 RepID=A0ABP7TP05_9BACT